MKKRFLSFAFLTISLFILGIQSTMADSIEQDLNTICSWYNSLVTDDKYKSASTEVKFKYAFDDKNIQSINYMTMKMFYSALRTTDADQRYALMKAYAEGNLGKKWECPAMKDVMHEFKSLDRLFQYAQ